LPFIFKTTSKKVHEAVKSILKKVGDKKGTYYEL